MGDFYDIEARSSNRYSSMLGRGLGEARRRIWLLIFLGFFLLLTVVAFRRQDTIKEVVNSRLHPTDSTAPVTEPDTTVDSKPEMKSDTQPSVQPSTKPDVEADSKQDTKPDTSKTDSKADTKSDMKSEKPSIWKGKSGSKAPKLGNGDRVLAEQSVTDIHNTTLGVRCISGYSVTKSS